MQSEILPEAQRLPVPDGGSGNQRVPAVFSRRSGQSRPPDPVHAPQVHQREITAVIHMQVNIQIVRKNFEFKDGAVRRTEPFFKRP